MKKKVIFKQKTTVSKYSPCYNLLIQADMVNFIRKGVLKEGKNYKIKITVEEK